jgi:hypothetical protein
MATLQHESKSQGVSSSSEREYNQDPLTGATANMATDPFVESGSRAATTGDNPQALSSFPEVAFASTALENNSAQFLGHQAAYTKAKWEGLEQAQAVKNDNPLEAGKAWGLGALKATTNWIADQREKVSSMTANGIEAVFGLTKDFSTLLTLAASSAERQFSLYRKQIMNFRQGQALDGGYANVAKETAKEYGFSLDELSTPADRILRQYYKNAITDLHLEINSKKLLVDQEKSWLKEGQLHTVAENFHFEAKELLEDLKRTSKSATAIILAMSEAAIDPEGGSDEMAERYLKRLVSSMPNANGGKEHKQLYNAMIDEGGIKALSDEQITSIVWAVNRSVIGDPERR